MRVLVQSHSSLPQQQKDFHQNETFSIAKLSLSLAASEEEVREVQSLRYKVFIEAMGLNRLTNENGLDVDEFDAYCDHLIVRDMKTMKVVGTYRILGAAAAQKLGHFYSETEFDLSRLHNIYPRISEVGRACIHPEYRSGAVIMMLWAGIAAYMRKEKYEFLIGCASMSLSDGGHNAAAVYQSLTKTHIAPWEYRVTPKMAFPFESREIHQVEPQIPTLLKAYMRAGAWIGGAPAWDPDFHSADLFVMLPIANLDKRYARHYGTDR